MRPLNRSIAAVPLLIATLLGMMAGAGCSRVSARLVEMKQRDYRSAARLTERRITVAGHEVVYLDRGSGDPMVLLHGFGGDKDNWAFFAREIPDRYRVIALDLPGFGESSRHPEERYDVRSQSARLLAFVDALGLPRFHLAGNSMGGHLAARFALDHPERVRSLTLIDAGGVVAPHPSEVARALEAGRNPLVVDSVEDFDHVMALVFVKQPPIPGFIKRYLAERALANRDFNQKIFADLRATSWRLEGELPGVRVPTLIVWGAEDRVIDVSAAGVFAAAIPGAQTAILPACGHSPMIEQPVETAQRYLGFLGSLPAKKQ
jgi:pimeloyl-ACP methyl ester carboxylesterase